jgi:hypothetical protein
MGPYYARVVEDLEKCLPGPAESVSWAGLLLEREVGFETGVQAIDAETVSKEEGARLRKALLFALGCHPDIELRGTIVHALAKHRDPKLKPVFTAELLSMTRHILAASEAMFQVECALDNLD